MKTLCIIFCALLSGCTRVSVMLPSSSYVSPQMRAAAVEPIVTITGNGPVQVSGDLIHWDDLGTITNSASWPMTTFASYENRIIDYYNTLAWDASQYAMGYWIVANDKVIDAGTNLVFQVRGLPSLTNTFRAAATNLWGSSPWSYSITAPAQVQRGQSVFFRGKQLKIKVTL